MSKDQIRNQILTENTAQGVLNHLRELESNRAHMQTRWIWELLQNARDASTEDDTHLVASVEVCRGELIFQHNGRGFTESEVGHLIYHGSTKLEDASTIGQYGSGFLTTHLLSAEIDVSGQLCDGTPFAFPIQREIGSVTALTQSMDHAWDEFHASHATAEPLPGSFTTRFRYPLGEDSTAAVQEGIQTLTRCAPFVVVFNRQFRRIHIESPDDSTIFEVIERIPMHDQDQSLQRVAVRVSGHGIPSNREYLLAQGVRASVAVPLETAANGTTCLSLSDIPRLFLGFPLIGTGNFSFPSVINSFDFTPTENRDGVYLGRSRDEANNQNQAVIQEACELHVILIQAVSESNWSNIHTWAEIPPISEQTWLNTDWLKRQLQQLVKQVRATPVILCADVPTAPECARLPWARDEGGVEPLWYLLNDVAGFRPTLPRKDEASGWYKAVESWANVQDCEATSFEEAWDGRKLVLHIERETEDEDSPESWRTLDKLRSLLAEDVCAVEWLDRLCKYLKDDGSDSLLQEHSIVLNQTSRLDKLPNLYRDLNVDDELKHIADDLLGLSIQDSLRDKRLTSLANEVGKGDYETPGVASTILSRLQELGADDVLIDEFAAASPRMLAWIVAAQDWSHLIGFPAFSTRPEDGSRHLLRLGQQDDEDADIPLAPVKAWPQDLRQFADLFPLSYIVADAFFDVMPEPDVWRILNDRGYVRTEVIVNADRILGNFLPDPLADGDHRTVRTVSVTDIVFLAKDKVGVMARVRDSQDRARLFFRFLTEWLAQHDREGLDLRTAECACGASHRYFRAVWLAPLVTNRWVPQGNDIRDRATAESLARLLRGSGWTPTSLSEKSPAVKLLEAMKITRLDLMREFVVSDAQSRATLDDAMTRILVATGGDLGHVSQFVKDLETDKDLPTHLADRRRQRQIVHENQRLGAQVENLVKEGLEGEGFRVERTGIGSDFAIEYDLIEEDKEIGIELSRNGRIWLVEVKATRDHTVRMTARQAETAVVRGDGFLLCVVPIGIDSSLEAADIRTDMRFIQNIGPRVEPLCQELDALNELRDEAITSSHTDIQLEIQAGAARIRVDDTVWKGGVCLRDLATRLLQTDL